MGALIGIGSLIGIGALINKNTFARGRLFGMGHLLEGRAKSTHYGVLIIQTYATEYCYK